MSDPPLLEADQLHKAFGQTPALTGASARVDTGEVLAVMGPSGSGKSTLLHCLAGIVRPDAGHVRYRGADLGEMPDTERSALRRTDFGFVFQFGQLVPELTFLENVALPLRLNGTPRRVAVQRATELLDRLYLADLAAKRPGEASGGQGQRVAVARALITGPKVIFADEPTGALDSLNGEHVMRLLVSTAKESQAAVVLVTHDPKVAAYADREIVVRDGAVRHLEVSQ
ncbi:macrolide ABC transporter ATP-binding protein [Actinosynnema sp. ALI-1.44]|uniref:ABC transporter ATP-binding protein n=1 Tax=Actinosynnema sp. ALI-1.44 TaxID=1933779 RepID=UPI00097C5984|nr:ABC transporter ATP-binding protein [Actinosynnema sp. ALI-1.44]ONI81328.1 macrolide ABC transporter ATP-binding protein [Actinosynnema sp. ALI-1.44]